MKRFFVIGNKTSQSLSPLIFNHWFKKYNIKAKYSYVEVNKKNLNNALLKKLNNKDTIGFNVTIPFKRDILGYLNTISKHAKNINAVNCVTVGEKIKGTNTDWVGYLNSIKGFKITKNKKILVLGYGGASQAIVYGFLLKGYRNITVFNRTKKLIKFHDIKYYTIQYSQIDKHLMSADLIINTTPINPLNKKQINKVSEKTVLSDIVYNPKQTSFFINFKKNPKIYGITMLLEQAIPCFTSWFGFKPKIDEALMKKINARIGW
jgi:shikimate dehydrogenase